MPSSYKILVTGGTGFIGKHLVSRLLKNNHHVAVIDNLSVSQKKHLPKKAKFYQGNIQDPKLIKIFKSFKPQVVFHLAADNRITSSISDTLNSNIIGTFNILNLAKTVNAKQFIFTSSAAVYGDVKKFPIKETHPTKPISAYGLSKLTGEQYCKLHQKYFPTAIFRFANVYGPGQSSSAEGGVVAIFIKKLLQGQAPIIYGDGSQVRDFVYVDDVVDALTLSLNYKKPLTVNIGSNTSTSIHQLLKLIALIMNQPVKFKVKPARDIEIKKSLFNAMLAQKTLGWQPKTPLKKGLKLTIDSFSSL